MTRNEWNNILVVIFRRLRMGKRERAWGPRVNPRRIPDYQVPSADADLLECGRVLTDDDES